MSTPTRSPNAPKPARPKSPKRQMIEALQLCLGVLEDATDRHASIFGLTVYRVSANTQRDRAAALLPVVAAALAAKSRKRTPLLDKADQ